VSAPVPRYEPPKDSEFYSEPTQSARYGGYSGAPAEPEPPPTPWYRKPIVLVGAGALTVIMLAALVFGVAKLATGSSVPAAITTAPSSPTTTPATSAPATPSRHGRPGEGSTVITQSPQTVTDTATPTDNATTPPGTDTATTTAPIVTDTSTSTVTQTVTATPTPRPFSPRPGGQ
jgi:hypothetical protein